MTIIITSAKETEMADWTDVLQSQGGIGMHEPLVDNEGKKSRQDRVDMLYIIVVRAYLFSSAKHFFQRLPKK